MTFPDRVGRRSGQRVVRTDVGGILADAHARVNAMNATETACSTLDRVRFVQPRGSGNAPAMSVVREVGESLPRRRS